MPYSQMHVHYRSITDVWPTKRYCQLVVWAFVLVVDTKVPVRRWRSKIFIEFVTKIHSTIEIIRRYSRLKLFVCLLILANHLLRGSAKQTVDDRSLHAYRLLTWQPWHRRGGGGVNNCQCRKFWIYNNDTWYVCPKHGYDRSTIGIAPRILVMPL